MQKETERLTKEMMKCADEILMEEDTFYHSVYLHIQSISKSPRYAFFSFVDSLKPLLQDVENVYTNHPRRSSSMIRAIIDALSSGVLTLGLAGREDYRENFMRFFLRNYADSPVRPEEDSRRKFKNLPVYVDLSGLSVQLLSEYMNEISMASGSSGMCQIGSLISTPADPF